MKLYHATLSLHRKGTTETLIPAFDENSAAKKLQKRINEGRIAITHRSLVDTVDGKKKVIVSRNVVFGTIEKLLLDKITDQAFPRARWDENANKFVAIHPTNFGRNLAEQGTSRKTEVLAVSYSEGYHAARNAFIGKNGKPTTAKSPDAKLKIALKSLDETTDKTEFEAGFRASWTRLVARKPAKKTTKRRKMVAA